MKSQAIPRALGVACAIVLAFASFAHAEDTERAGTYELAKVVKSEPVVATVDQDNAGDPQIQYGDPDDLGGGDQKGGDGTLPPRIPEQGPIGAESNLSGWLSSLIEIFQQLFAR